MLALVGWGETEPDQPGDEDPFEGTEAVFSRIRSAPGRVSLESMLVEMDKLLAVRAVGVPAEVFADVAPKVLAGWRSRCAVESPSHLRRRSRESAVTLLAALLRAREREITDDLTDLLIGTVHRIDARAHRKVTEELVNAFKRVDGKEHLLYRIAEAAVAEPAGPVSQVVFPAIVGGEQTLREIIHEYKTKGPVYRRTVQHTLKASYTNHYRRGMIAMLDVLELGSTIPNHPLLAALEYVKRHAKTQGLVYYPLGETPPRHKGIDADWSALVFRSDTHNKHNARSARPTRSPRSGRCGTCCAARRSGWSAPSATVTRTTTCRATSRPAASTTTPNCASPWPQPRSLPSCAPMSNRP